jgi:hypothetical protein
MTQTVQRRHAFTISLILNRIVVRSLTKHLPSSPLTVSERTASQRLLGLGGVESENERDKRYEREIRISSVRLHVALNIAAVKDYGIPLSPFLSQRNLRSNL